MADEHRFRRSVDADRMQIRTLRGQVCGYAAEQGVPPDVVERLRLAVSEALTNVVLHAYDDADGCGPMIAEAWLEEDDLVVSVRDEGRGLRPRPDSPGLGMGLRLITKLADDVRVRDRANRRGTCVLMRFSGESRAEDCT